MNIRQLRDFTEALLQAGVDPYTPVCIPDEVGEPMELTQTELLVGRWREDPSPKTLAPLSADGQFLFLGTMEEYPWKTKEQYQAADAPPSPAKEYRPGTEWWMRQQA